MECPICLETIDQPRRQCVVCGYNLHLTGWREAEPLPPAEDLQPAGAEFSKTDSPLPHVGRQPELDQLKKIFDGGPNGRPRLVWIEGPAGIGKSRLFEEAWASLEDPPARIEWQAISRGPALVLGPALAWVEQIAGIHPRLSPAQVDARLEQLADETDGLEKVDAIYLKAAIGTPSGISAAHGLAEENVRRNVNRVLGILVASQANARGVCLVVDNAHWFDEASAQWLDGALGVAGGELTVVVLTRDSQRGWQPAVEPDARLRLRPLGPGERGILFDQLTPALDFLPELRKHVIEQDIGTPLFIQELSRLVARVMAENSGPLRPDQVAKIVEIVPLSLDELIGRRLAQMDEHMNRTLAVASLLGPDCSLGLIECFDQIREGLEGRLRALEGRRIIELYQTKQGRRMRFVEGYVRELAYETMPEDRRRALHGEVAAVIEKTFANDLNGHLETLAWHWERAGDADKALFYLIRAADRRRRLGEYGPAIEFYRKAIDQLRGLEPSSVTQTRLARTMVQLARLLRLTGKADEAEEFLDAALELIEQLDNENLRVQAMLERGTARLRRGEHHEAQEILRPLRELARCAGNPHAECAVLNALGVIDLHAGHFEMALAAFRELAERSQSMRLPDLEADALNNTGLIYWRWSQYCEAARAFRAASALRLRTGDRFGLIAALLNLAIIQEQLGEIQPALRNYEQALEYARQSGYRTGEATLEVNLSNLQRRAGLVSLALEHAAAAVELAREIEDPRIEMTALENLGLAHGAAGRPARAIELLEQALGIAKESGAAEKKTEIELDLIDVASSEGPAETAAGEVEHICRIISRVESENWTDLLATACRLKGRLLIQSEQQNHLSGRDYLLLALDFAIQSQNIFEQRDILREMMRWSTPHDRPEDVQAWADRAGRIDAMIQIRPEVPAEEML
ncbi:tetratricopeptide repeat protein [bacterium]|nr:tetratricopeptide repeat protein [bacterium]